MVGLSPIVGALLAGLMIAETEYHGEVEAITAPFKGLALGVFLISVGMGLNLATIARNWRSEEHTSELQSLMRISYAVFCLKKKTTTNNNRYKSPTTYP